MKERDFFEKKKKSNGEKGGTTRPCDITVVLERNYPDQGLCNKI